MSLVPCHMNTRNRYFLGILIFALTLFILLAPSYGFRLRNFLSPPATGQTDGASIAAQNEALKAELAKLQAVEDQLPNASSSETRAMVYSRYPMNFKNELLIDAGAPDGVIPGKGVLFQGVLIGTVYQVFSDGSVVQTVFDPNFRMPVRIGSAGVDALLQGGAEPMAISISKGAKVQDGDIIYSAAPGIPYSLPIGEIEGVSVSANSLFQQATVDFAYDINGIQTVEIER